MANEAAPGASSHVVEALKVLVLHTVERSGPLHGYRIATLLEECIGGQNGSLDLPTLYSAILQQKQRGLLRASSTSHEGRMVRTYEITPRGRRFLKSARIAWAQSASLLGSLLEEQGRQRRELELAREVQAHFLASLPLPAGLGLDIAGRYRAAREVGGDYYDVIPLSDTSVAVALGDVCGKGIAAALLMATLRAFVRGQPGDTDRLAAATSRLNRLLHESCPAARYASLFYAVYDAGREELVYVNAGHPPPVLLDPALDEAPLRLHAGGPVLGLLPDCAYEVGRVPFAAPCVLVSYTDGLSDACDTRGADWGEQRVMSSIRSGRRSSAGALADHILTDVTRFMAGAPQQDDMTLLVIRRE
jgi:sigma-B regulation protein RsbU (phosphoserine phosphatase)